MLGIRLQVFVALQRNDAQGPWQYNNKLPSIEMHRDLTLDFQILHFVALCVDDIIVSTQFLNDEEFATLQNINLHLITLSLKTDRGYFLTKQLILFAQNLAEYMIRSTFARIKYQDCDLPARPLSGKYFEKGDIVILNNKAQNYKGEVQIITKRMINDGIRNLFGQLDENEQKIVDCLLPNQEFRFNLS